MKFFWQNKKLSIAVIIFLIIFLLFGVTYARYIYNFIDNYILESKGFYFNSSVLSINDKSYRINNWDGVNSYILTIDVNSKKNEVKSTTADIEYEILYECSSNVVCSVSKESGIIYESKKMDSYQLIVSPKDNFYEGDEAVVKTWAKSLTPYKKTLSATYNISVMRSNFSYNIEDNVNSKYLILNVINSTGYYQVEEAFDEYSIGDQVSMDEYLNLSDENKSKCFSSKITLEIPTDKVQLDMTTNSYLHRIPNSEVFINYDGFNYVSKYVFKLDASSSEKILFYKNDMTKDYTYPITNSSSIIGIDVEMAE